LTPLRPRLKTLSGQANMIVLIDNYDSFTFNLVHYLGGLGADVVVHRNDKISADAVIAMAPEAVVLSPGP
jgi:anthranilate synthase component 2